MSVSSRPLLTPAVSSVWEGPAGRQPLERPVVAGPSVFQVSRWHPLAPSDLGSSGPSSPTPSPARPVPPACLSGGFLASSLLFLSFRRFFPFPLSQEMSVEEEPL